MRWNRFKAWTVVTIRMATMLQRDGLVPITGYMDLLVRKSRNGRERVREGEYLGVLSRRMVGMRYMVVRLRRRVGRFGRKGMLD